MNRNQTLVIVFAIPLFLLGIHQAAYGQSFPISKEKAVWKIEKNFQNQSIEYRWLHTADSILVNDILYYRLGQKSAEISETDFTSAGHLAYRVEGPRVYFRPEIEEEIYTEEVLIYDFSAEPGDTLWLPYYGIFYEGPAPYVIDGADSIYVNGQYRRRLNVLLFYNYQGNLASYYTTWIEGVGDIRFPFYFLDCQSFSTECHDDYLVQCFSRGDRLTWASRGAVCEGKVGYRYYVDSARVDSGDGLNWGRAFSTVQEALAKVKAGDEIWIARGTYFPTNNDDRGAAFEVAKGVKIYGGFAGYETSLAERNLAADLTVFSGNIGSSTLMEDNSKHLVRMVDPDSSNVIDGVTLRDGYCLDAPTADFDRYGAAVLIRTINDVDTVKQGPVFRNCSFLNNQAYAGGAIGCAPNSAFPSFENCSFVDNYGSIGGSLYHGGSFDRIDSARFVDCTFENNRMLIGAAVYLQAARGDYQFLRCAFSKNTTNSEGGGITLNYETDLLDLLVKDCFFDQNKASRGSGLAINSHYCPPGPNARPKIRLENSVISNGRVGEDISGALSMNIICPLDLEIINCDFISNVSGGYGTAVALLSFPFDTVLSTIVVDKCNFIGNKSDLSIFPGALHVAGGLPTTPVYVDLRVTNSLFAHNDGIMDIRNPAEGIFKVRLHNNTFYRNGELLIRWGRSNLYNDTDFYQDLLIANCVFFEPDASPPNYFWTNSSTTSLFRAEIYNSLFDKSMASLGGADTALVNVFTEADETRLFINPEEGNLAPIGCGPLINQGSNDFTYGQAEDLAGNSRILNEVVDIGAIERPAFQPQVNISVHPSCYDGTDGALEVVGAAAESLNIAWMNETESDSTLSNLGSGTYFITLSDRDEPCLARDTVSLLAPDSLAIAYTVIDASSDGASDGSVVIDAISGGTPPYDILWDTGGSTETLANLSPGTYTLSIEDARGCTYQEEIVIDIINSTAEAGLPDEQWSVFPNPGKGLIQLAYGGQNQRPAPVWFCLYSSSGQMVKRLLLPTAGRSFPLDVTNFASGSYSWSIIDRQSRVSDSGILILK